MIKAKFGKNDEARALVLKIKGHARFDVKGKDIVCAAASILALTAAQDAEDAYAAGKLTGRPKIRLKDGGTCIVAQAATDEAYAALLHTFFVMEKGFLCLQRAAPDHVKVTMFGKKE